MSRSPVHLARAALLRIAELKLPPTPDNFRRYYEECDGTLAAAPPDPTMDSTFLERVDRTLSRARSSTAELASSISRESEQVGALVDLINDPATDHETTVRSLLAVATGIRATVEGSSTEFGSIHAELAVLRDELAEVRALADKDPLTGLGNRRLLDQVLTREIDAVRGGAPTFSVVLIDLDHFKQINDQHGHDVGDSALVHFARIARTMLRGTDFIARYGGEEFILVLPATGQSAAVFIAEKLQQWLDRQPLDALHGQIRLRFSAGVANWNGTETAAELLARADRGLYAAKGAGRNRVEVRA